MTCPHDYAVIENACADGMCPLCLAADNEKLRAALQAALDHFEEGDTMREVIRRLMS